MIINIALGGAVRCLRTAEGEAFLIKNEKWKIKGLNQFCLDDMASFIALNSDKSESEPTSHE